LQVPIKTTSISHVCYQTRPSHKLITIQLQAMASEPMDMAGTTKSHKLTIYGATRDHNVNAEFKAEISGPIYNGNIIFRAKSHPHYMATRDIPMIKMLLDQMFVGEIVINGETKRMMMYVFSHKKNSWNVGVTFPDDEYDIHDCTLKQLSKMPTKGVFCE